jgi:hypothetical protein
LKCWVNAPIRYEIWRLAPGRIAVWRPRPDIKSSVSVMGSRVPGSVEESHIDT